MAMTTLFNLSFSSFVTRRHCIEAHGNKRLSWYSLGTFLAVLFSISLSSCDADTSQPASEAEGPLSPGNYSYKLIHDGVERNYKLYVPDQASGQALPLVINMHGYGSNALQQAIYTVMEDAADDKNFLVVHPDGLEGTISIGTDTHWNADFGTGVDDIGFLDAMLDAIAEVYPVDPKRIYSTGMSNGGYMSYSLACALPERIAAVASVTGSMGATALAECNPGRAIPVVQFHGTDDATVPYNSPGENVIQDVIDFWVANNNCATTPLTTSIADSNSEDNSTVTRFTYTNCNSGADVILYEIDNGGHTWPGAALDLTGLVTNRDISATDVLTDFFNAHPLP